MPKLIQNLKEKILEQAKNELLANGFDALNIRSVAKSCGIAVGTMYNYFPSKDLLAASIMLEDWMPALERMKSACDSANTVREGLRAVYDEVVRYYEIYRSVWISYSSPLAAKAEYGKRHIQLVRQLADCILPLLKRLKAPSDFGQELFYAENILVCAGNSPMTFEMFLKISGNVD